MFENNAETREASVKLAEVGQERGLSIQNASVGRRIGRDLAMKIEDHVLLLHGFEDGVISFVGFDTTIRVCGYAPRIGLDT